jgi:hypothetical protein
MPTHIRKTTWGKHLLYGAGLLALFLLLTPAGARGQLVVDGGATKFVPPSITYDNETIGDTGQGTLTQFFGSNTVKTDLTLGNQATGTGTYNLYPFSTLTVGHNETIGNFGTGTFNQSGGTNMAQILFNLGYEQGSSGTYNLKSGSLKGGVEEWIGVDGTGIFNQSGGSNMTSSLYVALNYDSTSTYNLTGGRLQADNEYIGFSGTGTFNQSGGKNMVARFLNVAENIYSTGTYNLTGGELTARQIYIGGEDRDGTFNVLNTITKVTGDVFNHGTVNTTKAVVTWNGTFSNNGAYISDHAQQTFTDLNVNGNGFLLAASQDVFKIKNDFDNQSANASAWNTMAATLQFITGADKSHNFYIAGADHGSTYNYSNTEFSWSTLNILGQTVHLLDGNTGNTGTAEYVKVLLGANVNYATGVVNNIFNDDSNAINIYYDPKALANFYLLGRDYTFAGGAGMLIADAVPLPPSVFLLGSGLLGLGLLGWRRRRG